MGVYDLRRDEGWISLGIDHDAASFAVNAIRRWWRQMGARRLSSRAIARDHRRRGRQQWPARPPLEVGTAATRESDRPRHHRVSLPPGDQQVEQIEHRLFSHIAMNWRGTPLVSLAAIVSLIASTRSRSGLRVRSELDRRRYPDGVNVTENQMATVRLERHAFHGD